MDVVARLIQLKPDTDLQVSEWAATLNARKEEALATLRDEGVVLESWFKVRVQDTDYLLCFMRAQSTQQASLVAEKSPHAIDAYHKQFKRDAWISGSAIDAELLVDLVVDQALPTRPDKTSAP